jgi:hypothetical protein
MTQIIYGKAELSWVGDDGMEQDLTALAAAAAQALVQMMTADGWRQVKAAIVSLWRHAHPLEADKVGAELDAAQLEVLAARAARNGQAELDLVDEWCGRLRRLVAADPRLIAELRELVERFPPLQGEADSARVTSVKMQAKATGRGKVYQAGRDQKITER